MEWIKDVTNNVKLIKNNPEISSSAKREVENLCSYFLINACDTADYEYILERFDSLKQEERGIQMSFALSEIEKHVIRHI